MESYQKIFADDLNSGRCDTRNAIVRTLSVRNITKCLFCGALTEIPDSQKPIQNLSIYDPTGILTVQYHTGNREISGFLTETTLPVFVLCTAAIRSSVGTCMPMLESIMPVSREIRDVFVLAAADDLISHLTSSPDIPADMKNTICNIAKKALSTVQTGAPNPTIPKTAVLNEAENLILECCEDKKTVNLEELIETLNQKGISRETTLAVLNTLIDNGECYQPKPDIIRRL
ncbi:hypothetical protein [Methanogenium organophilum]|uniref:Uncharacterized protein n=1 Tax=Methanogenium organophilum TaxID=2199 RepID=A0A9X9S3K1_METOG|nr:hypothetical protein [Methanogenium organophilum]WAI01143.1 hypothetical protein OU421_12115 [Methanogenium organophilum]